MTHLVRLLLLSSALLSVVGSGLAQTATPAAAAASPTPGDFDRERGMTREERIKAHHARIEKIIAENRKKQEEQQKAAVAANNPAGGQPGQPGATPGTAPGPAGAYPNAAQQVPGQPLPTGPIQPAQNFAPPIQSGQKPPPAAAQGVRSEARTMLMFNPMDSFVNAGDTFETEVVAETKNGNVDAVSFLIRYPKQILNPLALDHSLLDPLVDGEMEYSFDPDAGEIYLKAPLKEAVRLSGRPLVAITWEAIQPTDAASIAFAFDPDRPTGLFLNKSNLLGTGALANDGVIKATVMIRGPRTKTVARRVGERGLIIGSSSSQPPPPTMALRLQPQSRSAHAGEEFNVDVVLDNETGSPFDHLRLYLQFDPTDLEVVDQDAGNGIRRGINIRDGISTEDFPFDFHRENYADNKLGIISYDAAAEITPIRGSGTVARMRFRAKRAIEQTEVVLVANDPGMSPTSDISLSNTSMLAGRPKKLGALDGVSVYVAAALPGSIKPARKPGPATIRGKLGTASQTN